MHGHSTLKIRDLIVTGKAGEHVRQNKEELLGKEPPPKNNPVPRLIAHIQQLINEAELSHKNKIEQRKAKGKTGIHVTRLVLNEFSLYVKDYPLSLDQYKEIIAAIAFFAKKLPPHILLTFSSLPVLWPNEVVHNVAIHVQSPLKAGDAPILHHFEKRKPAAGDRCYFDYNNNKFYPLYNSTYVESDHYKTNLSPDILLADTAISVNDSKQYRGTIKVILEPATDSTSEISLLVVNELCFDQKLRQGIYNTNKLIKQLPLTGEAIPQKASHVISSYSINAKEKRLVGVLTQADPQLHPEKSKSHRILSPTNFGENWHFFTCPSKEIGPVRKMNLRLGKQKTPSISSSESLSSLLDSIFRIIKSTEETSPSTEEDISITKRGK